MIGSITGNMAPIYWLVFFIVLLVIEIFTLGLTTIWFAGGALVACGAAALGMGLGVQVILFMVVSVILLVVTRPYAMKHFNKERVKTNAEALVGEDAVVLEAVDAIRGTGRVSVRGLEWSAKAANKETQFEKDETVTVVAIEGVKLIVTKKEAQ